MYRQVYFIDIFKTVVMCSTVALTKLCIFVNVMLIMATACHSGGVAVVSIQLHRCTVGTLYGVLNVGVYRHHMP